MPGEIKGLGRDRALARRSDPITSHEAAEAATKEITRKQRQVLAYAYRRGSEGFTDLDLEKNFEDYSSTYRSRRSELTDLAMIRDSGSKMKPRARGRSYIIWRITPKGIAQHEKGAA